MKFLKLIFSFIISVVMLSCAMTHSLQRKAPTADIKLPRSGAIETPEIEDVERAVENVRRIAMNGGKDSAFLMATERDSLGEIIMRGGNIQAVSIVAKAKTVAERNGEISVDFIVTIPATLQNSSWGLELTPIIENKGKVEALQPLSIRGELFSELQKRQYWQMNKFLNRILKDSTELTTTTSLVAKYYEAYNLYAGKQQLNKILRLESTYKQTICFPYLSDSRLDSVLLRKGVIQYYYTQKYRPKKDTHRLHLFFRGKVEAIDQSSYALANSDTLTYTVTSMVSLIDEQPRYMIQIIDKYVQVRDRNYIQYMVGRADIIDTLGQNRAQLAKIEHLMDTLINQYQFFVDSITITASSSPDGTQATNERIAGGRAAGIKQRLVKRFGREIDTLIQTQSIGEDWVMLKRLIRNSSDILHWQQITDMINNSQDLDATELQVRSKFPKDYAFLREVIYPQLRAVDFRYNLRRVDMIKDTVMLTVIDTTYMRGVRQLRDRDYVGALRTLGGYQCQNLAIVMLSLSYDDAALEILRHLPNAEKNAKTDYLTAIALSRLNQPREGLELYLAAIKKDPVLKFRGNLDPEIQILYQQNHVKTSQYNEPQ